MAKSKKLKKPVVKNASSAKTVSAPKVPRNVLRFSKFVFMTVWKHKRLFGGLALVAWVAMLLISGSTQQDQYISIRDLTQTFTEVIGVSGSLLQSFALLLSVISGGLNSSLGEGQQLWLLFTYVFLWLAVVWMLRHILAGHQEVKVRDSLYNAGAPLLSTLALGVVGVVQLLPMALVLLGVATAKAAGLLEGVLGVGILVTIVALMGALSLYWLTTTFIAGIIVTIPGTYPFDALRSARSVVKGYRIKLLLHVLWLAFILVVLSAVILLPIILVDTSMQSSWLPLVAGLSQLLTILALIYASSYVYLLYRGMIDD